MGKVYPLQTVYYCTEQSSCQTLVSYQDENEGGRTEWDECDPEPHVVQAARAA